LAIFLGELLLQTTGFKIQLFQINTCMVDQF